MTEDQPTPITTSELSRRAGITRKKIRNWVVHRKVKPSGKDGREYVWFPLEANRVILLAEQEREMQQLKQRWIDRILASTT